jgi:uncharacterized SAM-binding protein YcdF (DUF218 family)
MSDKRGQLWCLYSVFGFIALFLLGWVVLAGFVPPPSPADSAEHIASQGEAQHIPRASGRERNGVGPDGVGHRLTVAAADANRPRPARP